VILSADLGTHLLRNGPVGVEGGTIGKLGVEVSGRAVRDLDADGGALSTKCFNGLIHCEPEIRRGGDADRTLFGCAR
jgi:hypothetical protein